MPTLGVGLRALVDEHLSGLVDEVIEYVGEWTLVLSPHNLIAATTVLRDQTDLGFEQLVDLCGVDYLRFGHGDWETSEKATHSGFSRSVQAGVYCDQNPIPERYAVVYHLLSYQHNQRLRVRCMLNDDPPRLPSVVGIWASANWYEREAFDLYGILFDGHPDLRRILTDYGFIGHPLRKDFPLSGEVEVRYDPNKERVVYEPVTIQPRILVPKIIRHDERYTDPDGTS